MIVIYHRLGSPKSGAKIKTERSRDSGIIRNGKLSILFDILWQRGIRVNCTFKKTRWRVSSLTMIYWSPLVSSVGILLARLLIPLPWSDVSVLCNSLSHPSFLNPQHFYLSPVMIPIVQGILNPKPTSLFFWFLEKKKPHSSPKAIFPDALCYGTIKYIHTYDISYILTVPLLNFCFFLSIMTINWITSNSFLLVSLSRYNSKYSTTTTTSCLIY